MLILPGLIDPHVHLREPGATHKEDFDSGTAAALAGGFTAVLAMPNTQPPLTDHDSLSIAEAAAREKARCDYGLYVGAGQDNIGTVFRLAARACGLKLYLDQTYGPLRLDDLDSLQKHLQAWPQEKPVAAHAEGRSLAAVILLSALMDQPLHISHVSRADEIRLIARAKQRGFQLTCEVTPHHLFLTEEDQGALGKGRGEVRPRLATPADQQALWDHMDVIDCFATDHAPHTLEEKDSQNPPPGFPGLETALPLMLSAVREGRLTMEELIERMSNNPRRIFGLPPQVDTLVEVDEKAVWTVRASEFYSRCGWTPFEGRRVHGRVHKVRLRGQVVYQDGRVLAEPGTGRNLITGTITN
jgi:carbamoyl-phosphate synthase/aspartate carbamoyltransferase/dihydroorotase